MRKIFYKIKNAVKKVGRFVLVAIARTTLVAIMGVYVIGLLTVAAAFEKRVPVLDIVS